MTPDCDSPICPHSPTLANCPVCDGGDSGSLKRVGSASHEELINECLAWADSGEWNAGPRSTRAMITLAREVRRLRRIEASYEELAAAIETKWRLNQRTPNTKAQRPDTTL